MNLKNKRELAAKTLGVGKNRIRFNPEGLSEIKEAITKQDIQTLYQEGIITIKPVKGRKKIIRRKTRRGAGKIKRKIKHRKQDYVKITRKLRKYLKSLKKSGRIDNELYWEIRKKIKMKSFKNIAHMKEYLESESKRGPSLKKEKRVKNEKTKVATKKISKPKWAAK